MGQTEEDFGRFISEEELNAVPFTVRGQEELLVPDENNSSMEGCLVCSELIDGPSSVYCHTCEKALHDRCALKSLTSPENKVCNLCYQKESMDSERRGTKRRQEEQAEDMLKTY